MEPSREGAERPDDPRARVLAALPDATVVARAPGRVNLVGEHVDYAGFGVLPMAVDRSVVVGAAPRSGRAVRVRSVDPARFPEETIALAELGSRPRRGRWTDYVVAALRRRVPAQGLELVVAGDVPPDAGLSSSSALVVATFLALGPEGDRAALADEARVAERYVGTSSGGMDQAAALLSRAGCAARIDFRPLVARPIPLPAELAVIVVESGVAAPKGGSARGAYNERVASALAAARAIAAATARGPGATGDAGDAVAANSSDDPAELLLADVARPGELAVAERIADPLVRRRARFVLAEAARVEAAAAALAAGDLVELGRLVDASHAGLRDELEVSHPTVDALVAEIRAAGALGARIVGAGFGGCLVAIARRAAADAILARLRLGPGQAAHVLTAAGPATRELRAP